jgi:hypothetical protein
MENIEGFNWVTRTYLMERVQEKEIIVIEDLLTEMERAGQLLEQKRSTIDEDFSLSDNREDNGSIRISNKEMPLPKLLIGGLVNQEIPAQVKVAVKDPIQRELPVLVRIEEMLKKSPLRKRPVCEFYVNDQVYKGKVEGLRNGVVFLSEAYGMRWRSVLLKDIYRIKVLT